MVARRLVSPDRPVGPACPALGPLDQEPSAVTGQPGMTAARCDLSGARYQVPTASPPIASARRRRSGWRVGTTHVWPGAGLMTTDIRPPLPFV